MCIGKGVRGISNKLTCPDCGAEMQYDKKFNFWKCPDCRGEWWPEEPDEEEDCSPVLVSRYGGEVLPTVPIPKKKHGNRKSGRKRKKPVKKWKPRWESES